MLDILTGEQLAEWEAYHKIDPIGHWYRMEFSFAHLIMHVVNLFKVAFGDKSTKMSSITDFILDWEKAAEPQEAGQSIEEMKQILYTIAGTKPPKEGD